LIENMVGDTTAQPPVHRPGFFIWIKGRYLHYRVSQWLVNRDGIRVERCSSKSSSHCPAGATDAMHESVDFDYFGAPAGT